MLVLKFVFLLLFIKVLINILGKHFKGQLLHR